MGKKFSSYIRAQLFHSDGDVNWRSKTVETKHSIETGADIFWQERFEWEYEPDELAFLRRVDFAITFSYQHANLNISGLRLVIFENEFGVDDQIVFFCARLETLMQGQWALVRMLDMKGKNSGATVLVRFTTSRNV